MLINTVTSLQRGDCSKTFMFLTCSAERNTYILFALGTFEGNNLFFEPIRKK
jgi:hypothetical protein